MTPTDIEDLKRWIGRTETRDDIVSPQPVIGLAATLDRERLEAPAGAPLPALWNWLYFLPMHRQSELGADGHAKRGGFLPPVPLPRRMWAGSRLQWHAPLRVGDTVRRTSTIADVTVKQGRSGDLCFVRVHHRIDGPQGTAIDEEHDIVYRPMPPAAAPAAAGPAGTADSGASHGAAGSAGAQAERAPWQRDIVPDDTLLFRYSALTFNGHRIHYDRRYVTEVEGYPGLIVHGPLMATLLMELATTHDARPVSRFAFRALSPIFDTAPFSVCGEPDGTAGARLWIRGPRGETAMSAEVSFA